MGHRGSRTRVTPFHRAGSGEPLVLIHGSAGSWRVWTPALEALERHHDVLALTLPGHNGGPPLPATDFTLDDFVDLVAGMLDERGIAAAHLAGNSLGGAVALELLRRGRALSVTAFSPGGAWVPSANLRRVKVSFNLATAVARATPIIALVSWNPWTRRVLFLKGCEHGDRIPPSAFRAIFADSVAAAPGLGQIFTALTKPGPLRRIDRGGVPVVIAWPERDRLLPFEVFGAPFEKVVPGCQFVRLSGVGHGPFYDDPDLVAETILRTTARPVQQAV